MSGHPVGNKLVSCPYCRAYPFARSRGLENHIRQQPNCLQAREQDLERLRALGPQDGSPSGTPSNDDDQRLNGGGSVSGEPDRLRLFQAANADLNPSEPADPFMPTHDGSESEGSDDDCGPQSHNPANPFGPYQFRARDPKHEPQIGKRVGTKWEAKKANEQTELPFYPWASQAEFELVNWLSTEGLSQGAIDRYLALDWVSCNEETALYTERCVLIWISRFPNSRCHSPPQKRYTIVYPTSWRTADPNGKWPTSKWTRHPGSRIRSSIATL